MALPQIPLADDIARPGIEALLALRPGAARHLAAGRYGHVLAGWRAQVQLVLRRLASEAAAARLPLSKGQALRELARDYDAVLVPEPQTAIGRVVMLRQKITLDPASDTTFTPGVVKVGTRFRRDADPTASPPIDAADYEATESVFASGTPTTPGTTTQLGPYAYSVLANGPDANSYYTHSQVITVAVRATRSGSHANIPLLVGSTALRQIALAEQLWAPETPWVAVIADAAGGSTGLDDPYIVRLASALALGQYGPTDGAIVAGALSDSGVRHVAIAEDTLTGSTLLWIADQAWSYSDALGARISQAIADDWNGFGPRFVLGGVGTKVVSLAATALLTDPKYANDTTEIAANIRDAIREYFEDRPDFYAWRLSALAGVIATADLRVLTCQGLPVVKDTSGATVSEPSGVLTTSNPPIRWYVPDNALQLTFAVPS